MRIRVYLYALSAHNRRRLASRSATRRCVTKCSARPAKLQTAGLCSWRIVGNVRVQLAPTFRVNTCKRLCCPDLLLDHSVGVCVNV